MGELGKLLSGAAGAIGGVVGSGQKQAQNALGYTPAPNPAPAPSPTGPTPIVPIAEVPALNALTNPGALADPGMQDIYNSEALQAPAGPQGPVGVNPLAEQENALGMRALETPQEMAEAAAEEELKVEGDRFKPKKLDVLGQIADFFLQGRLSKTIHGQNMREAMKGLTNEAEPQAVEKVIRRISTFDHKSAIDMYQKYTDDKRADEAAQVLQEQRKLAIVAPFRSQYGVIAESNNPEEAYRQYLPYLRRSRDEKGLTDADVPLPDEYDELTAKSFYRGGIAPKDNERLKDADERLEQGSEKIDIQRDRAEVQERQGDARIGIAQQNANTGERRATNSERMTDSRIEENTSKIRGRLAIEYRDTVKDKSGSSRTVTKKLQNGQRIVDPNNKRKAVMNINGQLVPVVQHSNGKWYKDKYDQ